MIIIRIGLGITTARGSSRTGATTRTRDPGAEERQIPVSFAAPTQDQSTFQTDDVEFSSADVQLRDVSESSRDVKDDQVCWLL